MITFHVAKQYDLLDLIVLWGKEKLWIKDLRRTDVLLIMKDIVEDKEKFIGGARIRQFVGMNYPRAFCELCNIAVEKKYRHKGYGSALVNELVNRTWAKYDVYLICPTHLIKFYEPLGFMTVLNEYAPPILDKKCHLNEHIMKYIF